MAYTVPVVVLAYLGASLVAPKRSSSAGWLADSAKLTSSLDTADEPEVLSSFRLFPVVS